MTIETIAFLVLGLAFGLALFALFLASKRASDTETQLRRLMGASIDLNVALDQYVAEAEAPEEVRQKNTKEVVEKVNGLRLQLKSASIFLRE